MRSLLHNVATGTLVVASWLLLFSSVLMIWLYGTALNTDRFVGTVTAATSDPVVLEATSQRLAEQIVNALDVEERLIEFLPDRLDQLAGPLVDAVQTRMAEALEAVLTNEQGQEIWNAVLREMHSQLVSILRGTSPSADVSDNVLTIDLLAIVGSALERLQQDGVIEANIQIPDMSVDENRDAFIARLNETLNRDLPDDFGTIKVADVERLQAASNAVQFADMLVYALPILAVLITVMAILLADRRKRAVLWIVFVVELLLILTLLGTTYLGRAAAESVAAQDGPTLAIAIGGELFESLGGWIAAWIVAFALIGIVAYLVVRRRKVPAAAA